MVTQMLSLCVLLTRKSCTTHLGPLDKYPVTWPSLGYFASKSTKIQNKPSVEEGYSSQHLFKLPGLLLLFAQVGGSGRAGRWDWDSWHFSIFFFITCGCGFFAQTKTMMSFLLEEESILTIRLTLTSSDKQDLFVANKLVLHALDSRVPPIQARRNEIGEVLISDRKQVIRCPVPVVDCIGAKKVSK